MPSGTRWCPTPEQVMILEEIYRRGMTTPKPTQVQRITSYLSYYGKIEGKNVFYWFQNRKARERQKLRKKQQALMLQTFDHVQFFKHFTHSAPPPAMTTQLPQCSSSQEGQQKAPAHLVNNIRGEDIPEKWIKLDCGDSTKDLITVLSSPTRPSKTLEQENWMKLDCSDTKDLTTISPTLTRPLKTLELFPTKSAYCLRDECKHLQI